MRRNHNKKRYETITKIYEARTKIEETKMELKLTNERLMSFIERFPETRGYWEALFPEAFVPETIDVKCGQLLMNRNALCNTDLPSNCFRTDLWPKFQISSSVLKDKSVLCMIAHANKPKYYGVLNLDNGFFLRERDPYNKAGLVNPIYYMRRLERCNGNIYPMKISTAFLRKANLVIIDKVTVNG